VCSGSRGPSISRIGNRCRSSGRSVSATVAFLTFGSRYIPALMVKSLTALVTHEAEALVEADQALRLVVPIESSRVAGSRR